MNIFISDVSVLHGLASKQILIRGQFPAGKFRFIGHVVSGLGWGAIISSFC